MNFKSKYLLRHVAVQFLLILTFSNAYASSSCEVLETLSNNRIFIQQEHEERDILETNEISSGNLFTYYSPKEIRPDILEKIISRMSSFARLSYKVSSYFNSPWAALSTDKKLEYLSEYEAAVIKESSSAHVWSRGQFLLLVKNSNAPKFLADHPTMEQPLTAQPNKIDFFRRPEITSAKDKPAKDVNEAISRARQVIQSTGHLGTHFHVFVIADPKVLQKQIPHIQGMLSTINDLIMLESVESNPFENLTLKALTPWSNERSRAVAKLISDASTSPMVTDIADPACPKFTFVAFRYWGIENGQMVISFELRLSPKFRSADSQRPNGLRGLEDVQIPKKYLDFSEVERYLKFLYKFAENLANETTPATDTSSYALDSNSINVMLNQFSREIYTNSPSVEIHHAFSILSQFDSSYGPHVTSLIHPGFLMPLEKALREYKTNQKAKEFLVEVLSVLIPLTQTSPKDVSSQKVRLYSYHLRIAYQAYAATSIISNQKNLSALEAKLK